MINVYMRCTARADGRPGCGTGREQQEGEGRPEQVSCALEEVSGSNGDDGGNDYRTV